MDYQPSEALKRKRAEESAPGTSLSFGVNTDTAKASKIMIASASVLNACRTALVYGPTASRAALAKFGLLIDPTLTTMLDTVGNYDIEVFKPLMISVCTPAS